MENFEIYFVKPIDENLVKMVLQHNFCIKKFATGLAVEKKISWNWITYTTFGFTELLIVNAVLYTVWKLRTFSLILFNKNFVKSTFFTRTQEGTKELISRKKILLREFLVFPHCAVVQRAQCVELSWFFYHSDFTWNQFLVF